MANNKKTHSTREDFLNFPGRAPSLTPVTKEGDPRAVKLISLPLATLACLFAGILLAGCESQAPSRPVGSGCQYRDIPGRCRFESITPSGPNTYGDGFRTLFSFLPDSEEETSETGLKMIIGDGKDPTGRYLEENRLEVGSETRCVRRVRLQGPCSPEVFEFPALKNVY
jgi:hypothetical protein